MKLKRLKYKCKVPPSTGRQNIIHTWSLSSSLCYINPAAAIISPEPTRLSLWRKEGALLSTCLSPPLPKATWPPHSLQAPKAKGTTQSPHPDDLLSGSPAPQCSPPPTAFSSHCCICKGAFPARPLRPQKNLFTYARQSPVEESCVKIAAAWTTKPASSSVSSSFPPWSSC